MDHDSFRTHLGVVSDIQSNGSNFKFIELIGRIAEFMGKKQKEEFRIDLRGKYVDYFHNIKYRNNIDTNVEVFRYCLQMTEDLEQGDIQPASDVHPKLQYTLDHFLRRTDVQMQFGITDQKELVKQAVGEYIQKIDDFVKTRSLVHWDIRSTLQGDEHKVARIFAELHLEAVDGFVRFSQLLDALNWSNPNKLRDIMDEFALQGLVEKDQLGNNVIYHAF